MRITNVSEHLALGIAASRRQVAAALAGAGLGIWQAPTLASKKNRKAVKRAKKKGDKKCRNQEGQCVATMTALCNGGDPDPADAAACIAKFTACCPFLGDCQAATFLNCIFA